MQMMHADIRARARVRTNDQRTQFCAGHLSCVRVCGSVCAEHVGPVRTTRPILRNGQTGRIQANSGDRPITRARTGDNTRCDPIRSVRSDDLKVRKWITRRGHWPTPGKWGALALARTRIIPGINDADWWWQAGWWWQSGCAVSQ